MLSVCLWQISNTGVTAMKAVTFGFLAEFLMVTFLITVKVIIRRHTQPSGQIIIVILSLPFKSCITF